MSEPKYTSIICSRKNIGDVLITVVDRNLEFVGIDVAFCPTGPHYCVTIIQTSHSLTRMSISAESFYAKPPARPKTPTPPSKPLPIPPTPISHKTSGCNTYDSGDGDAPSPQSQQATRFGDERPLSGQHARLTIHQPLSPCRQLCPATIRNDEFRDSYVGHREKRNRHV